MPKMPKTKVQQEAEIEDNAELARVVFQSLPPEDIELLTEAIQHLDPKDYLFTERPFKSKRGQQAIACRKGEYKFSGLSCPFQKPSPAVYALMCKYAANNDVSVESVMVHVNVYPEGTSSGIQAHRDDEDIIDPKFPILCMQIGFATLHIWSGSPGDAKMRKGATRKLEGAMSYSLDPQITHGIKRTRKEETRSTRHSFTFRVMSK